MSILKMINKKIVKWLLEGDVFSSSEPCEVSEFVHFRKRIDESGIELILKESIRINGDVSNDGQVSVNTRSRRKTSL